MEMANKLSPGMRRAVVDLERYLRELKLRELTKDRNISKKVGKPPRVAPSHSDQHRILEDPLEPWLKVAMGALIVVAVGVGLLMVQQISGF